MKLGGVPELRGAAAVAADFKGRARTAVPGLVNGAVGVHVVVEGRMLLVFRVAFAGDRISAIELVGDRTAIDAMELIPLPG